MKTSLAGLLFLSFAQMAMAATLVVGVDGTTLKGPTAGNLRTAAGLVIGSQVQAWDAQLDTWATVTPSANGQSLVSAANYSAMRTLLGLVIGTDVLAPNGSGAGLTGLPVPTTITVADAAADTTMFPMLATDAIGNLLPKTDPGLTYNAATNTLVAPIIGDASSDLVGYNAYVAHVIAGDISIGTQLVFGGIGPIAATGLTVSSSGATITGTGVGLAFVADDRIALQSAGYRVASVTNDNEIVLTSAPPALVGVQPYSYTSDSLWTVPNFEGTPALELKIGTNPAQTAFNITSQTVNIVDSASPVQVVNLAGATLNIGKLNDLPGTIINSNGTWTHTGSLAVTSITGDGSGLTGITAAPFADTVSIVKGSADATKLLRFEVDGFTTATTRVLTPPNFDGTIATLAGTETLSNKTLTTPVLGAATGTSLALGGTTLGIYNISAGKFKFTTGASGGPFAATSNSIGIFESSVTSLIDFDSPASASTGFRFNAGADTTGCVIYDGSGASPASTMRFYAASGERLRLNSTGAEITGGATISMTLAVTGASTLTGNVTVAGKVANTKISTTLAAAATTLAVTNNFVSVTGDVGTNTLATITGGVSGMTLTLLFVGANLVTITDDASATANTVNLSAAFVSTANDTITLIFDGTSWMEISRAIN